MRLTRAFALILALLILAAAPVYADSGYDQLNPQNLDASHLTAKAAIVIDQATGEVLFEKNARRQLYPASTTKIMTCLIALEKCQINEVVTVPQQAVNIPIDSSRVPVKAGEQLTLLDLLYGMMMNSGNDAAIAIAMHVSGTVEEFAQLMNERAREIGCQNTNFVNPHGYHDPSHVTTAYDMALIARTAMQNRTFREIVAAKTYTMSATNYREKLRLETPINMYVATDKFYYPDLVGIKTGFHSKAGRCFVGAAEKDGVGLVSVVMKTDVDGRWKDTMRLMNYANTRYQRYSFNELFDLAEVTVSVQNADADDEGHGLLRLGVAPGSSLEGYYIRAIPDRKDQAIENFSRKLSIEYDNGPTAPINSGDIIGTVTLNGRSGSAKVVATRDVVALKSPMTVGNIFSNYWIYMVLGIVVVLIIAAIVVKARAAAARRRKKKEMLRRRRAAYDKYRSNRR